MSDDGRNVLREGDRLYRRGLVLGLTVAELFLLLVFLLLLALAAALVVSADEKEAIELERDVAKQELRALDSIRRRLVDAGISPDQIETLIEVTRNQDELNQQVETLKHEIDRLRPAAELGRAVEKAANDIGMDPREIAANPKMLTEALRDAAKLGETLKRVETLTGKLAEASRAVDLLAASKGLDPSCWYEQVTNEQGETREDVVFLFDVAVFDDHLVIRDRKVGNPFLADKAKLPIHSSIFMVSLSDQEFLNATRPIRKMAKEDRLVRDYSCVFYVRVWDETSSGAKERWKRATEKVIAEPFYRQTVNGPTWGEN